ncbi:MAG: sigma-70 family RNA polymerase sigma factor [Pseudomonadota bacterium]
MRIFERARKSVGRLSEQSDDVLLASVADGNIHAFEQLHRRYFSKLMRFAIRLADGQEAAEEVANDTLMTVWRTADRFEGRSKPSTWMFGIAYRMALKVRKKQAKHTGNLELNPELVGSDDEPAEAVIVKTDLAQALKQLTPEQKAVVELTYFNGYLYTEIAEILECPVGTVKTRMMTARRRLRGLLSDAGPLAEENQDG